MLNKTEKQHKNCQIVTKCETVEAARIKVLKVEQKDNRVIA